MDGLVDTHSFLIRVCHRESTWTFTPVIDAFDVFLPEQIKQGPSDIIKRGEMSK